MAKVKFLSELIGLRNYDSKTKKRGGERMCMFYSTLVLDCLLEETSLAAYTVYQCVYVCH